MSIENTIAAKLADAFEPEHLEVINESHLHAGHHHSGPGEDGTFDGQGETHFRVRIVSSGFSGLSRVDRHRAVNSVLADELAGRFMRSQSRHRRPGNPRAAEPVAKTQALSSRKRVTVSDEVLPRLPIFRPIEKCE